MMEQMKAAGVGGGEGEDAPEGDSSDDEGVSDPLAVFAPNGSLKC